MASARVPGAQLLGNTTCHGYGKGSSAERLAFPCFQTADKEGPGLACHWRIRHKLILGLGLVVGILALLLAGTYKGLSSYSTTINNIDSKLVELHWAEQLKEALRVPMESQPSSLTAEELLRKLKPAREALEEYKTALKDTLDRGRDPKQGFQEKQLVDALQEKFAKLGQAIEQARGPRTLEPEDYQYILCSKDVHMTLTELSRTTDELHAAIYDGLFERKKTAKDDCRTSLTLVLTVSAVGVLLMTGLLRFFYRWTFYPLRDLQQGVGRVAHGDFEHSIEVNSGDEMEELAAAFNDMTSRLRDMYRDLARQVNERSRQLVRSERLAGVGFLAAGVAHEINNPLASIAFCSEALEARLADLLSRPPEKKTAITAPTLRLEPATTDPELDRERETITKYLKMIQQEAFRCKEITQRLLEFSRGGERRREPTDLAKVVQSVLDIVHHLPTSKGKQIVFPGVSYSAAGNKLVASCNAQEIQSVVLNLVVNALESMEDEGTLTIGLRQRAGMAEMVFQDTGCGMNAEVLENIFEPFFTQSRTGKGTGLGLSITHRIINQHGGEIEAVSRGPGQGSTFTVRIPLQPVEAVHEEPAARAAA
jgi:two-component system, NtrC family, sensor kinase